MATREAARLRLTPRDAALAHRVHGHRRAVAQSAEGRQPATKPTRERALLGLQREQRRERRHRAAANVAQRVELVGRRRRGAWLPVLPLGAQVPIRGARGLQVEPPEPRVQDAVRAVQVVVRDARLRGVVAHVAALVVAALGELAARRVRHPHHGLVVLFVLLLLLGIVFLLLLQLAAKAQRLLGLGAATAGLEDGVGAQAVLHLLLLVRAARLGPAARRLLREESHGARGAEQPVRHARLGQPVHVALEALRRQPVRLGDVVQRRAADALDVRGPRLVCGVPLVLVAARRVGVQLGRDDVDAHLQSRAAHGLGRRVPGLVQPAHDGGRALARRLVRVDLAKALAALLAAVGHARAAALAQRLAHVLLEHAFAVRALGVGVRLLGRALGRHLLAHEHAREHAAHQGKVRAARVRRIRVLAVGADVATVFWSITARVHLQPQLRGDGVRRQGGGAVLGHDDHVARVLSLKIHRVLGGRHGRWLFLLLL